MCIYVFHYVTHQQPPEGTPISATVPSTKKRRHEAQSKRQDVCTHARAHTHTHTHTHTLSVAFRGT